MTPNLTPAFKAFVTYYAPGFERKDWTYVSASSAADARAKLEAEGYRVLHVVPVMLNHLGAEVAA